MYSWPSRFSPLFGRGLMCWILHVTRRFFNRHAPHPPFAKSTKNIVFNCHIVRLLHQTRCKFSCMFRFFYFLFSSKHRFFSSARSLTLMISNEGGSFMNFCVSHLMQNAFVWMVLYDSKLFHSLSHLCSFPRVCNVFPFQYLILSLVLELKMFTYV